MAGEMLHHTGGKSRELPDRADDVLMLEIRPWRREYRSRAAAAVHEGGNQRMMPVERAGQRPRNVAFFHG